MKISRNQFIRRGSFAAASLLLPLPELDAHKMQEKPAPLKPDLVKEFVGVCHSNLVRVKEMLGEEPLLLHSSWDWGGGDFESGIEAAGHVGNKEIAAFLLEQGARYNVFLAAMMNNIEVVKSVLGPHPDLLNAKGAHGFTLLHHAKKGSAGVVEEYLISLGAKETRFNLFERRS